mgnify:FL=1|tara:strand:+ start:102 stop:515 length:414 start_codon:yes stop_codon:yes gene_type:complete
MQIIDRKIQIVAAAALIDVDGRILISKRPKNKFLGGLWEFPGGKLEDKEKAEDSLIRELREELNIKTWKSCLAPLTFSTHSYTEFNLLLLLFVCRKWDGIIIANEGQEIKWVYPGELNKFSMPDADKPLIPFLRDLL